MWAGLPPLGELVGRLRPGPVAVFLALQLVISILTGLRIHTLLRPAVNRVDAIAIAFVHTLYLVIAPFRTGELVYVWLVARVAGQAPGRGLSQVLLTRLSDAAALAVVCGTLAAWTGGAPLSAVLGGTVFVLGLTAAVLWRGAWLGHAVARRLPAGRLATLVDDAAGALAVDRARQLELFGVSFAMWVAVTGSAGLLLVQMGLPLPLPTTMLMLALQRFVLVVPVPALGTFGTAEATFTAMTVPLGAPADLALGTMLVQHVLTVLWCFLLGGVGVLWLRPRLQGGAS